MRAVDIQEPAGSPPVPSNKICRCRLPILISGHDYFSGWGITFCAKCNKHYAYGVSSARKYAYMPRKGGTK